MIVVDTNVIAYLLLPGVHTEAARATLARDGAWAAPLLWRSELRNVLALYLRRRHITLAEASVIQATAEELVAGREYGVESDAVLALAATSRCSAYDCEFVALARALNVPLVTSDRQLIDGFPDTTIALESFGANGSDV